MRAFFKTNWWNWSTRCFWLSKITSKTNLQIRSWWCLSDGVVVTRIMVRVVLCLWAENENGHYKMVLLTCSPMENEKSLNAEELFEFLFFVLSVYEKSRDNVVAGVDDSWRTNRAMLRHIGPKFVRFHSHPLNLWFQDIIEQQKDVVSRVQQLMCKLRYQILEANCDRLPL